MRADGTGQRQLTNDAAKDRIPHWSPDGRAPLLLRPRRQVRRLDDPDGRQRAAAGSARHAGPALYPIPSPEARPVVAEPRATERGAASTRASRSTGGSSCSGPAGRSSRPTPGRRTAPARRQPERASDGSDIPGVVVYSCRLGAVRAADRTRASHPSGSTTAGPCSTCTRQDLPGRPPVQGLAAGAGAAANSVVQLARRVAGRSGSLYAVRASDEGDIWMIPRARR